MTERTELCEILDEINENLTARNEIERTKNQILTEMAQIIYDAFFVNPDCDNYPLLNELRVELLKSRKGETK